MSQCFGTRQGNEVNGRDHFRQNALAFYPLLTLFLRREHIKNGLLRQKFSLKLR